MKDKKVVFTDKAIILQDNTRSVVMEEGAKSLTEMYAHVVCQNRGDILDIGFGMGFSANKIYELADSYTCIEINPQIYQRAEIWAKDKKNVTIIFGDWIDILPRLGRKFDGIFMDTHHDPNYHMFESYSKFVAKEGSILSIFNYTLIKDKSELNSYEFELDATKFSKVVEPYHTINWTYFQQGKFRKSDTNEIKSKIKYTI